MRTIFSLFFIIIFSPAFSQQGIITIHDHAGAGDLVNKDIFFNKQHSQLPGYRIQIIASPKLQDIKDAKSSFLGNYSDFKATIVFEAPNYKLRVGNYQNRFDANRDLQEIVTDYPNAFICKDLITISDQ